MVGPFDRQDGLRQVDAVFRRQDQSEVRRLLIASVEVDGHQELDAILLRAVHRGDVLEVPLGHPLGKLNCLLEISGDFGGILRLVLLREPGAVVLDDVEEVVEVGVDLPAGLEDHLVHVLEEGCRLRLRLVLKPVLAASVDAGLVHDGILVVLFSIGLLPYLRKNQDVVAESVGQVGVEEDVLSVRAVHDLVRLPFRRLLAEDVLKVGLEDRVLAGAGLAAEAPGLWHGAAGNAVEEVVERVLGGEVDVTHVRLAGQGDFHPDSPPSGPCYALVGVPLFVPGEEADDVFAGDGLQAGVDHLVSGVFLVDGSTVEVVAAVGVQVRGHERVHDGVHLIGLEGLACSLEEVVKLCQLSAEVVDVPELLESVNVLS